jgi:hypothetical protein
MPLLQGSVKLFADRWLIAKMTYTDHNEVAILELSYSEHNQPSLTSRLSTGARILQDLLRDVRHVPVDNEASTVTLSILISASLVSRWCSEGYRSCMYLYG